MIISVLQMRGYFEKGILFGIPKNSVLYKVNTIKEFNQWFEPSKRSFTINHLQRCRWFFCLFLQGFCKILGSVPKLVFKQKCFVV